MSETYVSERKVQVELSKARLLLAVYKEHSNVIRQYPNQGAIDKGIGGKWYNEFIVIPLVEDGLIEIDETGRLVPTAPRYIGE